jgi:hypothetical protein
MKIMCVASLYNRPDVSEIFVMGMRRLGVEVLASVSEPRSLELCRRMSIPFIRDNNTPIGRKLNNILRSSLDFSWTHLMISGDDDVYAQSILDVYKEYESEPAIGFKSLYFVHPSSSRAVKFTYTVRETTVGAGRLLSRSVVEDVVNKVGGLWDDMRNRSLDASMDRRLAIVGVTPKIVLMESPCIIDIKTAQNIWSFDSLISFTKNGSAVEPASYYDVLKLVPEGELISKINT